MSLQKLFKVLLRRLRLWRGRGRIKEMNESEFAQYTVDMLFVGLAAGKSTEAIVAEVNAVKALWMGETPEAREQRRAAREQILAPYRSRIMAATRPAVAIEVSDCGAGQNEAGVGASKLGGLPSAPAGFEWPRSEGAPLNFVAQFNLAELAAVGACPELPDSGLLSFFHDGEAWGDPGEEGKWRVFWIDAPAAALVSCKAPPEIDRIFLEKRARFRAVESLPSPISDEVDRIGIDDDDGDAFPAYMDLASEHVFGHQLLGYATGINGTLQTDCEIYSRGLDGSEPEANTDEIRQAARQWRLLLQLGSEEDLGMQWGDAGWLYFCIREEDLRRHRFDKAWLRLECG